MNAKYVTIILSMWVLANINSTIVQSQVEQKFTTNEPAAVITKSEINIWIPVKNAEGVWTWNLRPEYAGEHYWIITFNIGEDVYELGFTQSSEYPPNVRGSPDDLLKKGITCIWKLGPVITPHPDDGMSERICKKITDDGLKTTKHGDGILISLTNKEWVSRINSVRPKTLNYHSSEPSERNSGKIRVTYDD